MVGRIKGMTASLLGKKFSWLAKVYWKENLVWSPGYFISTVGIGEREILKYVKWQQSQDSGQAKLELFFSATALAVGIYNLSGREGKTVVFA